MAALLTLSSAHATSVTINNFSFENGTTGTGQLIIPADWTAFNDNNFSTVQGSNYTVPIPDGTQYFAINEGPSDPTGGIFEDLGLLQANTAYTLTVAIGEREDFTPGTLGSPGIISLLNGTDNTGSLLTSTSGVPAIANTWQDYTTSFITGSSVSGDLTVELSVSGASTFQANFDNVRLTASPTPEPSAYALLGCSLILASLVLRHKQISAR